MNWQNGLQDLFVDRLFTFFLHDRYTRIIHSKTSAIGGATSGDMQNCYSLYLHGHEEVEVSIVLEGEYILECGGKLIHMRPADIAVVGANELHRDRIFDNRSAYSLAVIGLREGSFCLLSCGYRPEEGYFGLPAHTWIRVGSNTMLESLLAEVRARSELFTECFYAYLKAFYLFLHDRVFTRGVDELIFDGEYELFMRICQYMHENMRRRLSTRDICGRFQLNEQYLCRMFRKYSGSTVVQEINQARTMEAVRLLQDRDRKVTEIAYELGFDDPYYFTRVFTSFVGMSPRKFRDLVRFPEPGDQPARGTFYKRYLSRVASL